MRREDTLQTLEQIASRYPIILMDTSAIERYLEWKKAILPYSKEKETELDERQKFRAKLKEYVEEGMPIFLTTLVSREYLGERHYRYTKVIKKSPPMAVSDQKLVMRIRRKIRDKGKEKKRLIGIFEERNRILDLKSNNMALYNELDKKYEDLKGEHNLSETDFDFLISGAVLEKTRYSVALVSNDFGIVPVWRYFLKHEHVRRDRLSFFTRKKFLEFEML